LLVCFVKDSCWL